MNKFNVRRWIAIAMLIAGLVMVGSRVWHTGALALSLSSRIERLQHMATDLQSVNIASLSQEVHGARQELVALRDELFLFLWSGERLGGDLAVGRPLMDAAVESISAGDETLAALASTLGDMSPASFSPASLPRVLDALNLARPNLKSAAARLDRANTTLAQIKGPLSPRAQKAVAQATRAVMLARQGMGMAFILPEILGDDGPRTYLVLVQNSDELRPTGGFISNVGRVEVSHGAVITQTFEDSYAIDNFAFPYPDPPQPLFDYLGIDLWVFRDANWSPDFPTTARDAIALYQISRHEPIDGVIGINQKAVQALMRGLEPLAVESLSEPLTASNVEQVLREAWNPDESGITKDWMSKRKKSMGAVALAALSKLYSGHVNWPRLAQGALDAFNQRQLTIYVTGPAADELAALKWDGAIRQDRGDYLMVVDASVGYSKAGPLIDESLDYLVSLQPDGTGQARVTLKYVHRGTQPGVRCIPDISYRNVTYDKLVNRCLWNYVRLVVPAASQLQAATAHPAPGEYFLSGRPVEGKAQVLPGEAERAVLGQFFVVEYGKELQTRLEYSLPKLVASGQGLERYVLTLQKQPGAKSLPVHVTINLPFGARLLAVNPIPARQTSVSLEFDLTLDVDRQIMIEFSANR